MEPNISPESGLDVSSIIDGGYPTVGAPATVRQAAPATTEPAVSDPPAGGEKPKEEAQAATGGGAATETKTEPPAESAKRTDYDALDPAGLKAELAKRDREILSGEYGVLNLKAEHKKEIAGLQNAATFLELASKDTEPEKAIDHMVGLIAEAAKTTKEALYAKLGVKGAEGGSPATTAAPATDLKFVKDAEGREFFGGDDRQFLDGIVGSVMSEVRKALQEFGSTLRPQQDPRIQSLLAREEESQKQAELQTAAEGHAELVQKATELKYPGLALSREEAVEAAKYKLTHPNMDFEDAVFLVHKEKVRDHLLGKKTLGKGHEELPRGGTEHAHGNPPSNGKPGTAELAQVLAGYPTF